MTAASKAPLPISRRPPMRSMMLPAAVESSPEISKATE
jgi:hypothetical protein